MDDVLYMRLHQIGMADSLDRIDAYYKPAEAKKIPIPNGKTIREANYKITAEALATWGGWIQSVYTSASIFEWMRKRENLLLVTVLCFLYDSKTQHFEEKNIEFTVNTLTMDVEKYMYKHTLSIKKQAYCLRKLENAPDAPAWLQQQCSDAVGRSLPYLDV